MEAIDLCDDPAYADDVCVADVDGEVDGDGDIDVEFLRIPSCRTGLCDPLFCGCGRTTDTEDIDA